jgi:hypothetical protein
MAKSAGPPSIQIRSLKNDQQAIKILQLRGTGLQTVPVSIESNRFVLLCSTHTCIIGYDLVKFNEKFIISTCYSSLPYTLSTRWLAFSDSRLHTIHQSSGGINATISEQYLSYTGAMLNAAKSLSKSVTRIGESVLGFGQNGTSSINGHVNDKTLGHLINSTASMSTPTLLSSSSSSSSTTTTTTTTASTHVNTGINNVHNNVARHRHSSSKDDTQAGIVTIVDIVKLFGVCTYLEYEQTYDYRSCLSIVVDDSRKHGLLHIFKLTQNRSVIFNSIPMDICL